jgi:sugar diacid utilization regulator
MALTAVDRSVAGIAQRLAAAEDDMVRSMLARYREQVPEYATLDERELADVEGVSRANVASLLKHLRDGSFFAGGVNSATREGAARRARKGISLEAFLHSVRLWGQTFWETVLELCDPGDEADREAALRIAGSVMAHVDAASVAAARAYFDNARRHWNEREVISADLLDLLISGRGTPDDIHRRLDALKLRASEHYVVVLARPEEGAAPARALNALNRMLAEARQRLQPEDAHLLVGARQSEVVALYPAADRSAMATLREQAESFAAHIAPVGARVGIGAWHPGLFGASASYAEAREALAAAFAADPPTRVVSFDEIVVDHLLRSSPGAHQLLRDTVAELAAYDRRRQGQLLQTLATHLDTGASLKRTAEALHVHPNTVVYRLRRVHEITGRDPTDPQDALVLGLAVRLDALGERADAPAG